MPFKILRRSWPIFWSKLDSCLIKLFCSFKIQQNFLLFETFKFFQLSFQFRSENIWLIQLYSKSLLRVFICLKQFSYCFKEDKISPLSGIEPGSLWPKAVP